MKVEGLKLKGGLRIDGNLGGGEPFQILRLSYEGETMVRFPGIELSYDTDGSLSEVVVRMTEFLLCHLVELTDGFSAAFLSGIEYVSENCRTEVLGELDLKQNKMVLAQVTHFGKDNSGEELLKYSRTQSVVAGLDFGNGLSASVDVVRDDNLLLNLSFYYVIRDSQVILGVGDASNAIYAVRPLRVDLGLLDMEIKEENLKVFLGGVL